jgi:hypothetical protein
MEILEDRMQDGKGRIVRRQASHAGLEIRGELVGVLVGKRLGDREREVNEAREYVVFAKPSDAHRVAELRRLL